MSGFFQDLLNDVAGADLLFSDVILRDYTHAAKTFRTNAYEYAPKLKFLFHTYFSLNVAWGSQTNFGLLVKEIRLPSFSFQTAQLNQYNRKRIIQTKIKYEPIEITFHDDNGNNVTKLWEAYYRYYYNDTRKIGPVLSGRGVPPSTASNYNNRNIYEGDISGNDDWGFRGGQSPASIGTEQNGVKIPFFKNITVFGFNQHNFTAYTLINPVITNFSHDTYNYAEGGGTMTNRMTIDYETVVYNYGALDGRSPGNIVAGFGDPEHYDTLPSPLSGQGTGYILGQGGLVDAVGGAVESLANGDILGAVAGGLSAYDTINQLTSPNYNVDIGTAVLNEALSTTLLNTPLTRNTFFSIPIASASPGPTGISGSLTLNASLYPTTINQDAVQTGTNGLQYSATTPTGQIIAPNLTNPANLNNQQVNNPTGYQYAGSNLTTPLSSPSSLLLDAPFSATVV